MDPVCQSEYRGLRSGGARIALFTVVRCQPLPGETLGRLDANTFVPHDHDHPECSRDCSMDVEADVVLH